MDNKWFSAIIMVGLVAIVAFFGTLNITGSAIIDNPGGTAWDHGTVIDGIIYKNTGICNTYWQQCGADSSHDANCEVCCSLKFACIIEQDCNKIWRASEKAICIENTKNSFGACMNRCKIPSTPI